MKCRNGFVSNSSSASFILTISESLSDIVNKLYEIAWYIEKDTLLNQIIKDQEEHSTSCASIIASADNSLSKSEFGNDLIKIYTNQTKEYLDITEKRILRLKDVEETNKEELLKIWLEHNDISLIGSEIHTTFEGKTSMLNTMDDMPQILKELALYYLHKAKDKVELIVFDHD
jgi:hypothetical protein